MGNWQSVYVIIGFSWQSVYVINKPSQDSKNIIQIYSSMNICMLGIRSIRFSDQYTWGFHVAVCIMFMFGIVTQYAMEERSVLVLKLGLERCALCATLNSLDKRRYEALRMSTQPRSVRIMWGAECVGKWMSTTKVDYVYYAPKCKTLVVYRMWHGQFHDVHIHTL